MTILKIISIACLATVAIGLVGCSSQDSSAGTTAPPVGASNPDIPPAKKGASTHASPMMAPPGTKTGTK